MGVAVGGEVHIFDPAFPSSRSVVHIENDLHSAFHSALPSTLPSSIPSSLLPPSEQTSHAPSSAASSKNAEPPQPPPQPPALTVRALCWSPLLPHRGRSQCLLCVAASQLTTVYARPSSPYERRWSPVANLTSLLVSEQCGAPLVQCCSWTSLLQKPSCEGKRDCVTSAISVIALGGPNTLALVVVSMPRILQSDDAKSRLSQSPQTSAPSSHRSPPVHPSIHHRFTFASIHPFILPRQPPSSPHKVHPLRNPRCDAPS